MKLCGEPRPSGKGRQNHNRGRQACKRQHSLSRSRRLDRRGQGRHGLTVRRFTAKQQPAVGCCFFCTVFIHRRAASRTRKLPTLLRAQQNKGVHFCVQPVRYGYTASIAYLQDNGLTDYEQLEQKATAATERFSQAV